MTRDCPTPGYLFPSAPSFFSHQEELVSGITVHHLLQQEPFNHCLALIDLEQLSSVLETQEQLENIVNLLTPEEKKIWTSFSYPKRQIEWLGGRIAGKSAALILLEKKSTAQRFSTCAILSRENGAPEIKWSSSSEQTVSISISHSAKYAAALAAREPACGIDIQKITEKTQKVVSRFAEPDEIRLLTETMSDLETTQCLTLLWSAKEALKKALLKNQPVIFQGVRLKSLQADRLIILGLQVIGKQWPAEIHAAVLGEYILAFTVQQKNHAGTP